MFSAADELNKRGLLKGLGHIRRVVAPPTLRRLGEQLVALHTPASPDYAARFGIVKSEGPSAASKTPSVRPTPRGGFASTLRP